MLDMLNALDAAAEDGTPCAAATIVRASGSVPRPVGTSMLISGTGRITGSLSGGCVEAAVVAAAEEVLADGQPRLEFFGYSDEDAFAVGLSCGGTLEILIQPVSPNVFPVMPDPDAPCALIRRIDAGACAGREQGAAALPLLVTDLAGAASPADLLTAHGPALAAMLGTDPAGAAARIAPLLAAGRTGIVELGGPVLFLESRLAPPRLLLVGANDFSAALARQGRLLGYHVTVCDARSAFTTPDRFPAAHQIQVQWPDQYLRQEAEGGRLDARSVLCVLSHDAKFDIPVLAEALRLELAYVGALGSRRSHEQRMTALRAEGLTGAETAKLHSPIGLDIGAATPEETALSVFAEIVAARSGSAVSGLPLRTLSGPIHPFTRHHVSH
ncbi:XdhC family protein [Arthrobacter gengyunqii]|uniref:XdhC family protein n=1 Tax=Arthrobacter gengyunqii TaxID=2886940 RepID=A0A9X1S689_9MICC|nr:XdhC/CoxI family protein [Arthrobacter gengyunqii]MCC3265962.1 XdhC family protein [Arthrobacter gengyunqii]MCC3268677.1 XdhC family protein [Arthrobacter gengyunqii]UOY96063.1 XdhC family protein [Arthrobacter gengyunqii]